MLWPRRTGRGAKGYGLVALAALVALGACRTAAPPVAPGPVAWRAVDSLDALLPADIHVFTARDTLLPLEAWFVRIPARYALRVAVSDDPADRRETTSSLARDAGACVAVNGGYFRMGDFPASAVGLLVQDGRVTAPATRETGPDSARQAVTRAALGRGADGRYQVGWAAGDDALAPQPGGEARPWHPAQALGAGPMLLQNGQYRITAYEEGFGGTMPQRHPRTAAGIAANGDLILMVVDGRHAGSRGAYFAELARLMRSAGARDALNLDGGGSTTLVVRGRLVNHPTGGQVEREVMNALLVFCE